MPQLIHAVLSGQNIVILGEKGQAKTKIMRSLVNLLDEYLRIQQRDNDPVGVQESDALRLLANFPVAT